MALHLATLLCSGRGGVEGHCLRCAAANSLVELAIQIAWSRLDTASGPARL